MWVFYTAQQNSTAMICEYLVWMERSRGPAVTTENYAPWDPWKFVHWELEINTLKVDSVCIHNSDSMNSIKYFCDFQHFMFWDCWSYDMLLRTQLHVVVGFTGSWPSILILLLLTVGTSVQCTLLVLAGCLVWCHPYRTQRYDWGKAVCEQNWQLFYCTLYPLVY